MKVGDIINYPCHKPQFVFGDIAVVISGNTDIVPCIVENYVHSGISYKVVLNPMIEGYCKETVYRESLDNYKIRLYGSQR